MKLSRFHLAGVLVLLLIVPAVWGQAFGDSISGQALVCHVHTYEQYGTGFIQGSEKDSCVKAGSAFAQSDASVGGGTGPHAHATTKTTGKFGGAGAQSDSFDTVTLIPPPGFSGNQVSVTLDDWYSFTVKRFQPSILADFCWDIQPSLLRNCVQQFNDGHSLDHLQQSFIVTESNGVFEFLVSETAQASAVAGCSTEVFDVGVKFAGPPNWAYRFASQPRQVREIESSPKYPKHERSTHYV